MKKVALKPNTGSSHLDVLDELLEIKSLFAHDYADVVTSTARGKFEVVLTPTADISAELIAVHAGLFGGYEVQVF